VLRRGRDRHRIVDPSPQQALAALEFSS
jgi:hypothetical protein